MRIGIYDPYLDDLGGGEKYMMSIASCLADTNTVDVFWDNKEDVKNVIKRFGIDLSRAKQAPNIFSSRYNLLQRFSMTQKYDVIIALSDGSIPFLGSKRLFLHIQQPLARMQTDSLWGKLKLIRVTKFFCNSEYTRSYLGKKIKDKAVIIYPPVVLSPKQVKKENYVLHVGRFRLIDPLTRAGDFKKQHVMIEAFKHMVEKGLKNWKFILAVSVMDNDMQKFEEMKNQAKGFPIEFAVNKTNDSLWDLYSKAKIYWHASGYGEDLQKYPAFAEHFGISTVEAMGAGCVPVVINAGGQKEIVSDGENGLLWNSLEELEKKTLELTKDEKLWQKMSQQAKERAKDFSYEKFSDAVRALLQ
ncbi:MAG TPA: glycosyltransferase family 4 protein [Patescibacteria group bacterium]|nr:glycosyltransferase family 4 protein [Patescibacteria group bacterium]